MGFWLRNLTQVRHLGELLLKDAAVLATAEIGAGGGHLSSNFSASQVFGASQQGTSSVSTASSTADGGGAGNFYHSDLSALWAVASNRLNFVKAAYKQQKNMKVGPNRKLFLSGEGRERGVSRYAFFPGLLGVLC